MTSRTEYRQKRNTASRKYGRPLVCPESGHVLDHNENLGTYYCDHCEWLWDSHGQVIETKEAPNA